MSLRCPGVVVKRPVRAADLVRAIRRAILDRSREG
jgi:hypothetical protein